jgi:hypothetical protein
MLDILCLKSALLGKSTVELYFDLVGLQVPGGGSIAADVMVQAQRPDLSFSTGQCMVGIE